MSALAVSFLVVFCCCVSALAGIFLHRALPDDHFDTESKDVVKAIMGIIATMSALVLGLLIASAKSSYDNQVVGLQNLAVKVVLLDRTLVSYGPEAADARTLVKRAMTIAHQQIWPADRQSSTLDPSANRGRVEAFREILEQLSPRTESQRHGREAALQLADDIVQTRMLMFEQLGGSVSWPLLLVLMSWVSMLFLGFGLFARLNATIAAAVIIGACSVAGAIFLILELNQPYQGLIRIPDTSFRSTLAERK